MKYLLESPMQNKKIQLWALSMSGYNCLIEYIAGTTNTCADLLSRHPDKINKTSESQENEDIDSEKVLEVNDNLYEMHIIDSSNISLMELRKRVRHRNMRQNQNKETEVKDMEVNDEVCSNNSIPLSSEMSDNSGNEMEVDEVRETVRSVKMRHLESHQSHRRDVKQLFRFLSKDKFDRICRNI